MNDTIVIENGTLIINGKKQFLLSGDYPYYRDKKENWESKIQLIKELGVNIVTLYIPWRHHSSYINDQPIFFFNGENYSNSDLIYFLKLLKKYDLYAIVKPGPFVHAELKHGGLPDYVINNNNNCILKRDKCPVEYMGTPLPNILDSAVQKEIQDWYSSVCTNVLDNYIYPVGNIIAIQIGNEGIYCNANSSITDYDYSEYGIANYRHFLLKKYESIDQYNKIHKRKICSFNEINNDNLYLSDLDYIDWADWSNTYLNNFYRNYSSIFTQYNVPLIANLNPPANSKLCNSWIARNRFNCDGISFAFTNWLGNAMLELSEFTKLVFISSISHWPNIEDNWGHLWAGNEYNFAGTSIYHGIIMLSRGATGYNIYNICATDAAKQKLLFTTEEIETYAESPSIFKGTYCSASPILANGNKGTKYDETKKFNRFINKNSVELVNAESNATLGIFFCRDVFSIAAGKNEKSNLLLDLINQCVLNNVDFKLFDLDIPYTDSFTDFKDIIIIGYKDMPLFAQKQLEKISEIEAHIYYIGKTQVCSNKKCPTDIFKYLNAIDLKESSKLVKKIKENRKCVIDNDNVYTVIRGNKVSSLFIFLVNRSILKQTIKCDFFDMRFEYFIPGKGFAIIRIDCGQITQVYSNYISDHIATVHSR